MDICEECGRLFLTVRHALHLVECSDAYGSWQLWLCDSCVDDLAQSIHEGSTFVERMSLFGFEVPRRDSA